jgi:hypothetical protein
MRIDKDQAGQVGTVDDSDTDVPDPGLGVYHFDVMDIALGLLASHLTFNNNGCSQY